jgi:hypothetical protein
MIRGAVGSFVYIGGGKGVSDNEKEEKYKNQSWIYEDEEDNKNDVKKPLDKGKGKAVDNSPDSDDFDKSDEESDEDLDEDIKQEIEYLSKAKKTKQTVTRLIALKKLLRGEVQREGPLPPVPDFWGHFSKPTLKENTDKKHKLTQDTSTENIQESSSSDIVEESIAKKPRLTLEAPTKDKQEVSSSTKATEDTKENLSAAATGSNSSSSSSSSSSSNDTSKPIDNTNEKPKQTPTEYVHELETLEPMSYIWEDGD